MTIYWQFYFRVVWNVLSDGVNIVFGVWRNGGKLCIRQIRLGCWPSRVPY